MALIFSLKQKQFQNALSSLLFALEQDRNEFVRDAIIQRFEYTAELFWKMLKVYLSEKEMIETTSPKSCLRECGNVGLLSEDDVSFCFQMLNDRNLSSHVYREEIAESIAHRVDKYADFMKQVLSRLSDLRD